MIRTKTACIAIPTSLLCVWLLGTVGRAASPVLIAIGSITGFYEDFASETAGLLENGVPGNILGGLGSGFAHMGGASFVALPDRGPNAVDFNLCNDHTASYIPRFQTMHMSLAPSDPDFTTLPFTLTPMLVNTTLLWTRSNLDYGAGCGVVGNGEPSLNEPHKNYFSGRSDNFGPGASTDRYHGRLDPEGIRVSRDGRSVYITDEYGPYVYEFDRETGRRLRVYTLPPKFAVSFLAPTEVAEIAGNSSGRVTNKGMEGLAITPDGKTLVGAMQSPLLQDGGDAAEGVTRIVTIDVATGFTREYAYQLGDGSGKKTTVSEILAVNDHVFLVDERDSKGLGDDSEAKFKRIYRIDLAGAFDVTGLTGKASIQPKAVPKTLFLNVVSVLVANGMDPFDIPAKLEGLAFGEDVNVGGVMKHTLYLTNDNDFLGVTKKGADMVSNPNRWFVFAFDSADLPGYQPQCFFRDEDNRHDEDNGRDYRNDFFKWRFGWGFGK